jgi:hypothetical protein
MKHKLRLFAIHQTATSLQWSDYPNPRTRWYPALDESNRMKPAYFTIHLGKNPPPQNVCWLNSVFFSFKSTDFTSSTFPIQPDFSQNQPAAITLNTGSPRHRFIDSHIHQRHPRRVDVGVELSFCGEPESKGTSKL